MDGLFITEVVTKKSKEGNEYTALEVTFPCGYKKVVYLEKAEQYLAMQ